MADPHGGTFVQYDQAGKGHVVMDIGGPHGGVSPYAFDNQNGVPTMAQAMAKGGWDAARSSAAYVLGARPKPAPTPPPGSQAVTVDLRMIDFAYQPTALDRARLQSDALRHRPEFRQAKLRADNAEALAKRAFLDFFPDITGSGFYGASRADILKDYPYLEDSDIAAALEYAAQYVDHPVIRSA